jgi:hypothetical protein
MQTRKQSLIESIVNVAIGLFIATTTQVMLFPMFGIEISLFDNIKLAFAFTAVSIIRSYLVRRFFNKSP